MFRRLQNVQSYVSSKTKYIFKVGVEKIKILFFFLKSIKYMYILFRNSIYRLIAAVDTLKLK